jgi:hypothetical protein
MREESEQGQHEHMSTPVSDGPRGGNKQNLPCCEKLRVVAVVSIEYMSLGLWPTRQANM